MSMFVERLDREYPQATKKFERVVEQTVKEQLEKSYEENNVAKGVGGFQKMFRMAMPVTVCVLLVCGTVVAANYSHIQEWVATLGSNKDIAEKLIKTDVEVVYEEEKPIFEIESSYIDGTRMVYTAKLQEGAAIHPQGAKDHVIVNGIDCLNEYFEENPTGSGCYEGSILFSNEFMQNCGSPERLDITLGLYMSERVSDEELLNTFEEGQSPIYDTNTAIEEFTFSVPAEGLEVTQIVSQQEIELDDGCVKVLKTSVAPSAMQIELQFEFASGVAEEILPIYRDGYRFVDSNGVVLDVRDCATQWGYGEVIKGADTWTMVWDMELVGFDYTSDTITFIPYTNEYGEDGKRIPGTETLHEDKAFTINLRVE